MTMFMLSIVSNDIHLSLPVTGDAERAVAVLRGLPHGHHPPLPHRPRLPRSLSPHILWLLLHHPQQVAFSQFTGLVAGLKGKRQGEMAKSSPE